MDETEAGGAAASTQRGTTLGLIAVGLSIAALAVSLLEVSYIRDQLRAEAWPYLFVGTSYSADGYEIRVENKGVGPARVRSLTMTMDGAAIGGLDEAIEASLGPDDAFSYELYRATNPAPGVMSADERVLLFVVPWEPRTRALAADWSKRAGIEICYCSIFDECWLAVLNGGEPVGIAACPSAAGP